jgi:hypothetical protein
VDNEKGLLIDFNIIGTELAGQPVSPSLTVNFGNIAPGSIEIAEWFFTCSLEGLFTSYSASFQDLDPLGNPLLSPIQGVSIHEMTHMVQADGAWNDGQPDFLVIDPANINGLPNILYLSDGTTQPVSVVQALTSQGAVTASNLQAQITANFPAGFTYLLVLDPAGGQFPLQAVLYANGTNFLTNDFWITDRTFLGQSLPPLLQTNLNLFVYNTNAGPETYTLIYQTPASTPQTNAPVSAVFALPAQSPPTFGVVWSGANDVGQAPIAYYDIYVSDNGGPFTVWQSQTTATAAFYTGAQGHTYSFYSIATDTAGNRQATPLQPQAQTTITLNATPPTISIASNVTLQAGLTLVLNVTASDPNPLNTLTFSLGPGAPAGVVVNPGTGQITWATSPTFGGTTNLISVIATDNGQPPLNATGTVTVVLLPVAYPPYPVTLAASGITPSNATLNALVTPNDASTAAYFQWGATTNYGNFTASNLLSANLNTAQAVTAVIGNLLPGATNHFQAVASNSAGTSYGADLVFITLAPPVISIQPTNQSVVLGGSASFSVSATGIAPLVYQWQFVGTNLASATNTMLVLNAVASTNAGSYDVVVSDTSGSTTSAMATLSVLGTAVSFVTNAGGIQYSNGQFHLSLSGLTGQGSVLIEVSTNFTQWTPIFTNPPGFGTVQFVDPTASNHPFRYYRATTPAP